MLYIISQKKGKFFFGPPIKAETEPADARTASDGLPVDCTIEFVAFSHQLKAVYYIGAQLTVDSSNQITGNEEIMSRKKIKVVIIL